jgi:hypothetical protein
MTSATIAGLRRVKAMCRFALLTQNGTDGSKESLAEHARTLGNFLRAQRALKLPRVKPEPKVRGKRGGR